MYIQRAKIENFRLFEEFKLGADDLNVPDGVNEGSGLTVFVGENGTGKTTLLEALALPLVSYRSDDMSLHDFRDINKKIEVKVAANAQFEVKKTMPRASFQAIGFHFYSNLRTRDTSAYPVSPITKDTKYIPAPSESIDDNSVELRASVDNPYSGPRFKDNDYLFIDKNRNKQLESGMFSSSRFDRLLDNFNFQYLKTNHEALKDPNGKVRTEIGADSIDNAHLRNAFDEFESLCGYKVGVSLLDNQVPYRKAFLTYEQGNDLQLPITSMGNGYQMLLAILCQYHLSLQSGRQLIIFIDEIELHLHNKIQKQLAELLLKISATSQIIITTHSAEVLKSFAQNSHHKLNVLVDDSGMIKINPADKYVLPTPSVNESAYVALGVDGVEYFNELYSYLMDLKGKTNIASFDAEIANGQRMIAWHNNSNGRTENLSVHSCIRHKIHHPDNTTNDTALNFDVELPSSIQFLRQQIINHAP